jgi:hypothetical protein
VHSLINRISRWFPHGYGDAVKQLGLFVLAELSYEAVRGLADGAREQAMVNGQNVISLEKSLHTFFEPNLQSIFIDHRWIIDFANYMYMNSHFVVTTAFLVWLYFFRNQNFYFVRNMFMVAMGIALVGYLVFPTAPPRFMPEWGFFDAVSDFTGVHHDSVVVDSLFNPYAAVPSMHVCFALMVGGPLARLSRHRLTRIAWSLYPLLVTFVIVATANHFLADAFLGALTAGLAAWAAAWLARARPAVWTFTSGAQAA